mgnify:FL=1
MKNNSKKGASGVLPVKNSTPKNAEYEETASEDSVFPARNGSAAILWRDGYKEREITKEAHNLFSAGSLNI